MVRGAFRSSWRGSHRRSRWVLSSAIGKCGWAGVRRRHGRIVGAGRRRLMHHRSRGRRQRCRPPVRTAPQVARSAPAKGSYRCSRREATPTVHLRILAAADHDRAAIELADSHRRDRAGVTGERARRHRSHRVRALCGDQCAAQGGVYHVGAGDDVPVVDDETRPDRTRPPREADQADVRETLSCHRLCAARSRQR